MSFELLEPPGTSVFIVERPAQEPGPAALMPPVRHRRAPRRRSPQDLLHSHRLDLPMAASTIGERVIRPRDPSRWEIELGLIGQSVPVPSHRTPLGTMWGTRGLTSSSWERHWPPGEVQSQFV